MTASFSVLSQKYAHAKAKMKRTTQAVNNDYNHDSFSSPWTENLQHNKEASETKRNKNLSPGMFYGQMR